VLVMLAFGGIGTLFGPIVGAITFTIVDEVLIDFGQLRQVAYGILIIVLFLWMPRGVIPTLDSLWGRLSGRVKVWERMKRIFLNTKASR
jgi:branched-chain amino acid transport system permease protein